MRSEYLQCIAMDGCFAHIIWLLLQVGSVKIASGSQQELRVQFPRGSQAPSVPVSGEFSLGSSTSHHVKIRLSV